MTDQVRQRTRQTIIPTLIASMEPRDRLKMEGVFGEAGALMRRMGIRPGEAHSILEALASSISKAKPQRAVRAHGQEQNP